MKYLLKTELFKATALTLLFLNLHFKAFLLHIRMFCVFSSRNNFYFSYFRTFKPDLNSTYILSYFQSITTSHINDVIIQITENKKDNKKLVHNKFEDLRIKKLKFHWIQNYFFIELANIIRTADWSLCAANKQLDLSLNENMFSNPCNFALVFLKTFTSWQYFLFWK